MNSTEILRELELLGQERYNNNCQIPYSPDYIRKMQQQGNIGKKRKKIKC